MSVESVYGCIEAFEHGGSMHGPKKSVMFNGLN